MPENKAARVRLIREKIECDPVLAFRVLETIWARQKPEERFTGVHMGHDSKGFTEADTEALNALYERFEDAGRRWWKMTAVDVVRCQRMMVKYARQYLQAKDEAREAKERMTA